MLHITFSEELEHYRWWLVLNLLFTLKNIHILSLITIQKEARAKWSNSQQISTPYKFLMTTRALSFSCNS